MKEIGFLMSSDGAYESLTLEPNDRRKTHESHSADTDVWLTPPYIKTPLGEFDLDPCAAIDQPWPTARHQYTKADNGLLKPWFGRVWLNPPYGAEAAHGLKRLAEHGNGVALIFARTETAMFFDYVWNAATAVLFLRGRVKFHFPDGRQCPTNAGAPSALIAYGDENAETIRKSGLDGRFVFLA
jgi:hypothetical protein